ncbi:hypothetical protein GGS23DRAFT_592930 [Durotheca rogersii]|uniref:uncharacterized protein n=1 Tax=Durotheca rogersii TaxID=419775 RepID=UPI0022205774|nr:uncharacterized protein GGS23DRAFT_592930 [Durotheca rogersii]KAI5867632.1 hypothetical protein GGS23DRAFT_592930 [Durotheca rogersii]
MLPQPHQRQRTLIRRLFQLRLRLRPARSPSVRSFTYHTTLAYQGRPQLPFLSVPLSRKHQFRYLTTERKRWLAYEFYLAAKYTVYLWAFVCISFIAYWSLLQEWLERTYPTPPEWRFTTRLRFRTAKWVPHREDPPEPDWVVTGSFVTNVIERLEDPEVEGAGLQKPAEGGVWIDGIAQSGYDVTAKSEQWRRGYYEALMLAGQVAENLDDQVHDTTRGLVFPANQVIGPSNPRPKPIGVGSPSAPREKDCEPAFAPPEVFYVKILTTRGFTPKQKLDAALAYASWLDFKHSPDAAERIYEWALTLATDSSPSPPPYDPHSYVLNDSAPRPSANLLVTLTALATHRARAGNVAGALPILISVLRARRSLPPPPPGPDGSPAAVAAAGSASWSLRRIVDSMKLYVVVPEYPPPPADGTAPPVRDARELCEEAALHLYIGEILYSASASASAPSPPAAAGRAGPSEREDGLAWTREAVDLAEEQLHRLAHRDAPAAAAAKKTCRECLAAGLDNWRAMVARLAREERERQQRRQHQQASDGAAPGASWWPASLWGGGGGESAAAAAEAEVAEAAAGGGRWAAEENVVRERTRRAGDLLQGLEPPPSGFWSIFQA